MRRAMLPLLLTPLLLGGCYTVLRHPRVDGDVAPSDWEPVEVRSDCTVCHSDWDLARYDYAFHPGWYPTAGPWPRWYWDPWWVDVVVVPQPGADARRGSRTSQGAGLENDRLPGTASPLPTGVWAPPAAGAPSGGVVTVPGPGPSPRAGDLPAGGPPAPSVSTPGESQPAERLETPRQPANGSPPRAAQPTPEPRPATPKREAAPAPNPAPSDPNTEETPRANDSQGQGMTNERRGPNP